ncbi:MAG: MarC family protein [Luteibaculum sp.]
MISISVFLALLAGLFSVVNPFGAMPVFLALTKDESPAQRTAIAGKAAVFFCIILLVAFFLGMYILSFFGITVDALRIAGGLIIFGSGSSLLKGDFARNRAIDKGVKKEALEKDDISLTPLAIPMLSGPGSISYLIGIKQEYSTWLDYAWIAGVIILTALFTYIILRFSPKLLAFLGKAGFNSLSRIIGFIVMSIGVQYVIGGITSVYLALTQA